MGNFLEEFKALSLQLKFMMALLPFLGGGLALYFWCVPPQPTPLPPIPDSIGGVVYCDFDAGGAPTVGIDSGAPGVVVELWQGGATPLITTTTQASGKHRGAYRFDGLSASTTPYEIRVRETSLPGVLQPPNRSQPPTGDPWPMKPLGSGQAVVAVDFGYLRSSTSPCP